MKKEDATELANGIAALCVRDVWNEDLGEPFGKKEEIRKFMKDVVDRVYSVLLHMDDPEFMRKLTTYGSLIGGIWGKPQEIQDLLKEGFVADVDHMAVSAKSKEQR